MAAPRDPWPSRSSILRFNLDAVFLSGSLNSFKDPQLVLKTQAGPLPRVPYTGNRSRVPVTRHVLMVHVKDKATELETLDLGAFTSSSTISSPDIRSCVEYLSSDHSLIFRYAKGGPSNACTLRVKFQEASDLNTVVAELRALHIRIEISPSLEPNGMAIGSGSFLSSQSQPSPPLFLGSSSQDYHSVSPPLIHSQGSQSRQISLAVGHQLLPAHLVRQRSSQHSSHPPTWSSISPVNRVTRPATAIGIPGTLGEGLYRVSKVASASGNRAWQRRSSRLAEVHRPGTYTFSKHFDRTLDRSDIAKLTKRILRQDDDSPAMLSQENIDNLQVANVAPPGKERSLSNIDYETAAGLLGSLAMQQSIPEYPQPVSRQSMAMTEPDRTASGSSVRREHISRGLSRTHSGDLQLPPRVSTPPTPGHGAAYTDSAQTTWIPPSMRQDAKTSTTDDLEQIFQSFHEGLCDATRVWDDLMEKGRKETESVGDDAEAFKIWSSYAEMLVRRLDTLASVAVRKMRQASGGRAT